MADTTNEANFSEVLAFDVQVDDFKSQLSQVEKVYDEWIKGLGNKAEGIVGNGIVGGLQSQLQSFQLGLTQAFASLSQENAKLVEELVASAQKIDAIFAEQANKQAADADKNLSKRRDALQKRGAIEELGPEVRPQRTPTKGQKLKLDIDTESLGTVTKEYDDAIAQIQAALNKLKPEPNLDQLLSQLQQEKELYTEIAAKRAEMTAPRPGLVEPGVDDVRAATEYADLAQTEAAAKARIEQLESNIAKISEDRVALQKEQADLTARQLQLEEQLARVREAGNPQGQLEIAEAGLLRINSEIATLKANSNIKVEVDETKAQQQPTDVVAPQQGGSKEELEATNAAHEKLNSLIQQQTTYTQQVGIAKRQIAAQEAQSAAQRQSAKQKELDLERELVSVREKLSINENAGNALAQLDIFQQRLDRIRAEKEELTAVQPHQPDQSQEATTKPVEEITAANEATSRLIQLSNDEATTLRQIAVVQRQITAEEDARAALIQRNVQLKAQEVEQAQRLAAIETGDSLQAQRELLQSRIEANKAQQPQAAAAVTAAAPVQGALPSADALEAQNVAQKNYNGLIKEEADLKKQLATVDSQIESAQRQLNAEIDKTAKLDFAAKMISAGKDLNAQLTLVTERLDAVRAKMAEVKNAGALPSVNTDNTVAPSESLAALRQINTLHAEENQLESNRKAILAGLNADTSTSEQIQERFNAELQRTASLADQLSAKTPTQRIKADIADTTRQMRELEVEMEKIRSQPSFNPMAGAEAGSAAVAAQSQLNAKLQEYVGLNTTLKGLTKDLTEAHDGFFSGAIGKIGSMIEGYGQFAIAMGIVTTAASLLKAALEAPFKAVADGVKYLAGLETKAADLAGAINANVTYSKDLATNLEMSGRAGSQAMLQIQDNAIKARVTVDGLTTTVRALLEAKGVALTGTMQGLITLATNMQQIIEKESAKGQFGGANAVKQINDLLNGKPDQNNLFLKTLNLSTDSWKAMREEALKNKDILAQLAPALKPYLDGLSNADESTTVLVGRLKLMVERIEAAGASEAFVFLKNGLIALTKVIDDNRGLIEVFLQTLIGGATDAISAVTRIANAFGLFDAVGISLKYVVTLLVMLRYNAAAAFDGMASQAEIATTALKGNFAQVGALYDEFKKRQEQRNRDETTAKLEIFNGPAARDNALLTQPVDKRGDAVVKTPPPKSDLSSIRQDFQDQKKAYEEQNDLVRKSADEARQYVKAQVETNQLSHKSAVDAIAGINKEELSQLSVLYAKVLTDAAQARARIASDTTAKPQQKTGALKALEGQLKDLEKQYNDFQFSIGKTGHDATTQAAVEQQTITKDNIDAKLKLQKQEQQEELAVIQEAAREGRLTSVQQLDAQQQVAEKTHRTDTELYDQKLSEYADDTVAYNKALNDKNLADQAYQAKVELYGRQRVALQYEEYKQALQYNDQLRAAKLSAEQATVTLGAQVSAADSGSNYEDALFVAKQKELDLLVSEKQALLAVAQAKNAEVQETRQLTLELQKLQQERVALLAEEIAAKTQGVTDPTFKNVITRGVINENIDQVQAQKDQSEQNLAKFDESHGPGPLSAEDAAQRQELDSKVTSFQSALDRLIQILDDATPTAQTAMQKGADALFGPGAADAWKQASGPDGSVGQEADVAATALANLSKNITQQIDLYKQASKTGGALGGVGSVLSQGVTGQALGAIPIAGPIINAVGSVMMLVGNLIGNSMVKLGEQMTSAFKATIAAFQAGQTTLNDTLQTVQAQRADAESRLHGSFWSSAGGDQRKALVPQMTAEITQLEQQQQQALTGFDQSLDLLRLHSTTLSGINTQWQAINKQVVEYLAAGGDANKAAEFLALQLQQIKLDAANQLNQGAQQGIQDAIQLNGLLRQKVQLQKDFATQEFALVNADSIERTQAGAVTRGAQLSLLRTQYQQNLDDLNNQLNITQQKVAAESQIFNIATDINALHRQDDALTMASLTQQLQKYQDLKTVLGASVSTSPAATAAQLQSISEQMTAINKAADYVTKEYSGQKATNLLNQYDAYRQQLEQQQAALTQTPLLGGSTPQLYSLGGASANTVNTTATIQINVNGASSPAAVANEVSDRLTQELARQTRLSTT